MAFIFVISDDKRYGILLLFLLEGSSQAQTSFAEGNLPLHFWQMLSKMMPS